jgi:copper chaperone
MMALVRLKVEGMSCGHCVAAVERGLNGVSGVEKVTVDLDSGVAVIEGVADAQALIDAIIEEGYEARIEN